MLLSNPFNYATKSAIFKKAHEMAKKVNEKVGDYQIAFKWALEVVYKAVDKQQTIVKLKRLGFESIWQKGSHKRIYINLNEMKNHFKIGPQICDSGFNTHKAKSSLLESAKNDGHKSIYFDVIKGEFVGHQGVVNVIQNVVRNYLSK